MTTDLAILLTALPPVGSSVLLGHVESNNVWRHWRNAWCAYWLLFAYRHKLFHLFFKFRLFFHELGYLCSRLVTAVRLFPHREECALYLSMTGSSFKKPNYVFKVFDKFHSACWPRHYGWR